MPAPMRATSVPGVYSRGSRWVVIYRKDGRQHKQSVPTFAAARERKVRRRAEAAAQHRGPTIQAYALEWVDHYAGRGGHDFINNRTRREYRRLLITYAFEYFDADDRMCDVDEHRAQAFVDWLCRQPGPDGRRLSDQSIRNAVLPLRACLHHAVAAGALASAPHTLVLPRRRGGRAYMFDERRFLTREQLSRLLAEVPDKWRPFFDLLASTGLRVSEAIGLHVMDASLDADPPRIRVRRAIVGGQVTGPKSRHGRRTIPISESLAGQLAFLAEGRDGSELLFRGAPRRRAATREPALPRAHSRCTACRRPMGALSHPAPYLRCAGHRSGCESLRLQRWMGHHSAAFTLDHYGHLIDGELGPSLDLTEQLHTLK